MRICIYILLLLGASLQCLGQAPSPQAKLSLLTCAQGDLTEDTWGHSALRYHDPVHRIDKVYNYGTYDFSAPNFIGNFLKGKLDYILGVAPTENFVRVYDYLQRSIREQALNIEGEQLVEIYNFLESNALPENRVYAYEFFDDNCSTRIRDLFETILPGFSFENISQEKITFRQLLDTGLQNRKWTDFGIDLILGTHCDREADYRGAMFLPNYLHDYVEKGVYSLGGEEVPLVKNEQVMIDHDTVDLTRQESSWLTPILVFSVLLIVEMLIFFLWRSKSLKFIGVYDFIWFLVMALASSVMMFMWFGTAHQTCDNNWNLLWANPAYLVLLFVFWKKQLSFTKWVVWTIMAGTGITLLGWGIIPQQYHIVFIPICLISLLKLYRFQYGQKQTIVASIV